MVITVTHNPSKLIVFYILDYPCRTTNFLDDWQRSVAFAMDVLPICDNFLEEGWYRITSAAGDRMPTECPLGGFRCNTAKPIYLDKGKRVFYRKSFNNRIHN